MNVEDLLIKEQMGETLTEEETAYIKRNCPWVFPVAELDRKSNKTAEIIFDLKSRMFKLSEKIESLEGELAKKTAPPEPVNKAETADEPVAATKTPKKRGK